MASRLCRNRPARSHLLRRARTQTLTRTSETAQNDGTRPGSCSSQTYLVHLHSGGPANACSQHRHRYSGKLVLFPHHHRSRCAGCCAAKRLGRLPDPIINLRGRRRVKLPRSPTGGRPGTGWRCCGTWRRSAAMSVRPSMRGEELHPRLSAGLVRPCGAPAERRRTGLFKRIMVKRCR